VARIRETWNRYRNLLGKSLGENNIEMDLRKTDYEDKRWMELV
jgi:hypothetical protein